jgi:hypothetical protein
VESTLQPEQTLSQGGIPKNEGFLLTLEEYSVTRTSKGKAMYNDNDISKQWYQERARETKASFNLAIALAATTAVFGLVAAGSLFLGNVSATAATTAAGIVSGVTTRRTFKLYEQASQSLDEAVKVLLDDNAECATAVQEDHFPN